MNTYVDSRPPVICYIALGSNMGDRGANLAAALQALANTDCIEVVTTSSVYETVAVGGPQQQDNYFNAAAKLTTTLTPHELLGHMHRIERDLGRTRMVTWGPRTIDLDILLYGDQVIGDEELVVPHPLMHERRFVMEPLAEIAPEAVHPLLQMTAETILASLIDDEMVRDDPDDPDYQ